MSNLVKQIDRIEDIKELFVTEYVSFVKPAGKPPIQTPIRTIHKNNDYMIWRAEIESELDCLPQSYFVDDIRKNFKKIDTGFSEELSLWLCSIQWYYKSYFSKAFAGIFQIHKILLVICKNGFYNKIKVGK